MCFCLKYVLNLTLTYTRKRMPNALQEGVERVHGVPPAPTRAPQPPGSRQGERCSHPEHRGITSKTHKSPAHMHNRALVLYKLILNQGGQMQRSQDKHVISLFTSGRMEKISSRKAVMKQREKPLGLHRFIVFSSQQRLVENVFAALSRRFCCCPSAQMPPCSSPGTSSSPALKPSKT